MHTDPHLNNKQKIGLISVVIAVIIPALVTIYGINNDPTLKFNQEEKIDQLLLNQGKLQSHVTEIHEKIQAIEQHMDINGNKINHINLIMCKNHPTECEVLE